MLASPISVSSMFGDTDEDGCIGPPIWPRASGGGGGGAFACIMLGVGA